MNTVNSSFLISLSIIACGFFAKKIGIVKEHDGDSIARIVFNFTLPAVVITAFSTIVIDFSLIMLMIISVLYGLGMTALALTMFRKRNRKEKGMLSMLLPSFNIGLFAYPLVEMIWGTEGLTHFGMFDMGNAFIVFGTNYVVASIYSDDNARVDYRKCVLRAFRSVPFMAYIVTLTFVILHIPFPPFFLGVTGVIAKANMPLSLLLLGIYLSFNFDTATWKKMAQVITVRYGVGLCVGICLYLFLPVNEMLKITVLLAFSLPISLAVVPYSVEFRYDSKFVGTINNVSIVLSYCIMWIAITFIK
jgi:predicted permease